MTSLFSKPKAPPKPKQVPDPDKEGPLYQEMRDRRLREAQAEGGRASTIMTGPSVAGDYTRTVMG